MHRIVRNQDLMFGRPVVRGVMTHFAHSVRAREGRGRTLVRCRVSRCSRHFLHRLTLNCAGRVVAGLHKVPFKIGDLRGERGSLVSELFPSSRRHKNVGTAQLIIETLRLRVVSLRRLRTSSRWSKVWTV